MRTIVNKTTRPLRVPLPGGKVLHLGPKKSGQIADPAADQRSQDGAKAVDCRHQRERPGYRPASARRCHITVQRSGDEAGQAVERAAQHKNGQRFCQRHDPGRQRGDHPGGAQQRQAPVAVCQVPGRQVRHNHRHPHQPQDQPDLHRISAHFLQVQRLEIEEGALAQSPGRQGNGQQDQVTAHNWWIV